MLGLLLFTFPFFSFILASYLMNVPYTDYQDWVSLDSTSGAINNGGTLLI